MTGKVSKAYNSVSPESAVDKNMASVHYFASQLYPSCSSQIEYNDLVQTGLVGLMEAYERYDPSTGVKFTTFVNPRIRGSMVDFIRSNDWAPRSVRENSKSIRAAFDSLTAKNGSLPFEEEVAKELDITLEEYRSRIQDVKYSSILSISDLARDGDPNFDAEQVMTVLASEAADAMDDPTFPIYIKDLTLQLAEGIDKLTKTERLVLSLYYYEELLMSEIANLLGVTESRISQVHSQIVMKLRSFLGVDDV